MASGTHFVWETSYVSAILETDNTKLQERISQANLIIAARLEEMLANESGTSDERTAILDALNGLRKLKEERLGARLRRYA
jgi:hypothetical protein